MEDIFDAADEIGSQSDKVLTRFYSSLQEILYAQGWAKDDVDLYVASGLLPRIAERMLQLCYELYLHFQQLIAHDPDPARFKEFTLLHVTHHARQLRKIRMYATRRSQMILRSYTYLWDAHAKGYMDIKLVGIVTQKLQDMTRAVMEMPATAQELKPPKDSACNHCHSELHKGGMAACPLVDFKAKIARPIARDAGKKVKEEPEIMDRLIAEERAKK
jgi:hypothetical protein